MDRPHRLTVEPHRVRVSLVGSAATSGQFLDRRISTVAATRYLIPTLGDRRDVDGLAFEGFQPDSDAVLMLEVAKEARRVRQHKQRLVLIFAAMGHFREALEKRRRRRTPRGASTGSCALSPGQRIA